MGAGAAVSLGSDPTPLLQLSLPVGGPLATVRAEAAALLSLLTGLREQSLVSQRLALFIDSLCLLQFLSQWGKANFWPGPKEIPHFDILLPLIKVLQEWVTEVVLVMVKSHAGCYHNEIADELAEVGRVSERPVVHDGPQKYGTLHIQIQPFMRSTVAEERVRAILPQDRAPNKSIIRQVVQANIQRAVRLRNTIFVRDVVRPEEGTTVARVISHCSDSAIRCWMQGIASKF